MPTIILGNVSSWQTFSSVNYVNTTTGVMTYTESSNRDDGKLTDFMSNPSYITVQLRNVHTADYEEIIF